MEESSQSLKTNEIIVKIQKKIISQGASSIFIRKQKEHVVKENKN